MLLLWHGTFLLDGCGNAIDQFGDGIGQPEAGKGYGWENVTLERQGDEEQDCSNLSKTGEEEDE